MMEDRATGDGVRDTAPRAGARCPGGKGGAMPGGTYGIIGVLVALILLFVLLRLVGVI